MKEQYAYYLLLVSIMWEIDRITSISLSKPAIGYWIEQLLRQIRFTFNASINLPLLRATDEMIIASINKERQTRERERNSKREREGESDLRSRCKPFHFVLPRFVSILGVLISLTGSASRAHTYRTSCIHCALRALWSYLGSEKSDDNSLKWAGEFSRPIQLENARCTRQQRLFCNQFKKKLNKLHIEIESKCKYSKPHIEISTQHVSTKQNLFESARALKSRKIW